MSTHISDNPKYLDLSFASICTQSIQPNQLVVVKDGPLTPELDEVINKYTTEVPMKIVALPKNVGLAEALNEGLKQCEYEVIFRQDSDDVSLSNRFEVQLKYLENDTKIAALGTQAEIINNMGEKIGERRVPTNTNKIFEYAKLRSPLSHPTVAFKKSIILEMGGYPNFRKAQDYALWSKLLVNGYKITNTSESCVLIRNGDEFISRRSINYFLGEYRVLQFQRRIGFINNFLFFRNIIVRFVLRTSPQFIMKIFYNSIRKQ